MSVFGKLKGLLRKNKKQTDQAVDKAADFVEDKVGEEHADKVETAAEKVKDVLDKIDGDDEPANGSGD